VFYFESRELVPWRSSQVFAPALPSQMRSPCLWRMRAKFSGLELSRLVTTGIRAVCGTADLESCCELVAVLTPVYPYSQLRSPGYAADCAYETIF
jgi:hypothetical protein